MRFANDLHVFFKSTQNDIFIEAEARPDDMKRFITKYNTELSRCINISSDGIIVLKDDANKWGVELRIYFYHTRGIPESEGIHPTKNNQYRGDYLYRINNNELVWELFDLGYKIGLN